jgi:hypothetical protein
LLLFASCLHIAAYSHIHLCALHMHLQRMQPACGCEQTSVARNPQVLCASCLDLYERTSSMRFKIRGFCELSKFLSNNYTPSLHATHHSDGRLVCLRKVTVAACEAQAQPPSQAGALAHLCCTRYRAHTVVSRCAAPAVLCTARCRPVPAIAASAGRTTPADVCKHENAHDALCAGQTQLSYSPYVLTRTIYTLAR